MTDTILIEKNRIYLQGFEEMDTLFVLHFLPPDRFSIMNRILTEQDYYFFIQNHVIESPALASFFREISQRDFIICVHVRDFYLPMDTLPVKNEQLFRKLRT